MAEEDDGQSPPQPKEDKEQEEQEQEREEYESDPEDQLLPSAMRRREASDDESDGGMAETSAEELRKMDQTPDGESDGEGGAPGYEDDEEYDEEDDLLEEDEGLEYEEVEEDVRGGRKVVTEMMVDKRVSDHEENVVGGVEGQNQGEGEKKTNEPFAVPTAGAFYMHDDRFRGSRGGGRHKRMRGGRKLWETKDDSAWVHDRFEQMTVQDTNRSEDRRSYRGRFRGRGRARGTGRGNGRGNRSQSHEGQPRENNERPQSHGERPSSYDNRTESYNEKSQTNAPKIVRGRGPRRYEPFSNNSNSKESLPFNRPKQNQKMHEPLSSNNSGRQFSQTSTVQPESVVHRKQVFNSSLNSASPPFYPSGTASQESSVPPNRNAQAGGVRGNSSSVSGNNFAPKQSTTYSKGKTSVGYIGSQEKQPIDDSQGHVTGNPLSVVHVSEPSASSSITSQPPYHRFQGRSPSASGGQQNYQQSSLPDQIGRASAPGNSSSVQPRPLQASALPILRPTAPHSGQYSSAATAPSPNLQVQPANISEVGDPESPTAFGKSNAIVSARDKTISQTGGRGAILYNNGAQFIGANGALTLSHSDQNFPGTPALLPVMQFPGQPNGGGPTVGMALPGYVAQPQLGFGGSEMAWLPMLAGTAGAIGPSYAPYITLDGNFHSLQTGPASTSTAPKEISSFKPDSTWKTSQRSDQENDEFGQRQNKPRRYSEMNFGQ